MGTIKLFAVAAGLIFLSSCEKDWVCQCTNQDGDITNHTQEHQTLNQARTECNGREFDQTILGVHTSNTCSLK